MKTAAILLNIVGTAVAAADAWTWVDIEGSMCMDGKQTGVWVRTDADVGTNLGVYLYGGGACFNALTCATAAKSNKPGNPGSKGIFDTRSDNPLAAFNWMGVPYCTGDVHAGDTTKFFALQNRHFAGANNLKLMMAYAVKAFPSVETLLITGESAGGFGSIASYDTMRSFYPDARGVLMDDSGPIIDDDDMAVCLQAKWRNLWKLNKNLPADCPCNNDEGNLGSAWDYMQAKYPKDSFSLISSQSDEVISTFYAYGDNDCATILPVGYNKLKAGLDLLAKKVSVYQIPGKVHCHTGGDEFYSRVVQDQALYQWIGQLLDASKPDPSSVQPTEEDIVRELFPSMFPYTNTTSPVVV